VAALERKRTLMSAFVDLMNRTRRDHVITIEREINIVHDRGNSFVSQREVRQRRRHAVGGACGDARGSGCAGHRGSAYQRPDERRAEGGRRPPAIGGFSAHTAGRRHRSHQRPYAPESRPRGPRWPSSRAA
jgi:hypothetical protein